MWSRSRGGGRAKEESNGGGEGLTKPNGNDLSPPLLVRAASHAGSWYAADAAELQGQLSEWLQASGVASDPSVRAVIAPHAGYRYSGRCAAYAFGFLDPSVTSRIFVLGPSHHHFTRRCMLTSADMYSTPLGDIDIDKQIVQELRDTGLFEDLPAQVDEAEHSLEMHLPYLVKMMMGRPFKLVPIVVGSLQPNLEAQYGKILAPYLEDTSNFFSVSSDFCHWGSRFHYTPYDRSCGAIHESIEALDREGIQCIETGQCKRFTAYLRQTENTICGRHPISVLLQMLEHSHVEHQIRFVQYEQSSKCTSMRDSSVSYASGIVMLRHLEDVADSKRAKTGGKRG